MTNWVTWHDGYDNPESSLPGRLAVVRRRLGEALDLVAGGTGEGGRLLSLCSGDGRDSIPVLAAHHARLQALLVEQSEPLARAATERAAGAGDVVHVEVRCGDAADPSVWADVVPVDVLMLCGIFGNISPADIKTTIAAVAGIVRRGGVVIWTRGRAPSSAPTGPDLRGQVRAWFSEAGLPELGFDGDPEAYGVGINQVPADAGQRATPLPPSLFTFLR